MRLLFIALLFSQSLFAQPISVKDMFDIYTIRADTTQVISKVKAIGFNEVSYYRDQTLLKGKQAIIAIFKNGSAMDALEYRTRDSLTYKSWDTDLKNAGAIYWMKDGPNDIYTTETLEILTHAKDYYGLTFMDRPKR
jgi:hypothetical protein